MKWKAGLITANRHLIGQVRSIVDEFFPDVELKLVIGLEVNAVKAIPHLCSWGAEVILCSSLPTADLIQANIDIPVIYIPKHPLDVMEALARASIHPMPIGLSSYLKTPLQLDLMRKLLHVEIKPIVFHNQEDLEENLKTAFQEGMEVIVGGIICQKVARIYGKKSVLIRYGKENVFDSFQKAKMIALTARDHKEKNKLIQTIIEYAHEGVMVIDRDGKILFCNPYAEKILAVPVGKALNRPVGSLITDYDFGKVLHQGKSVLGEVSTLKGAHIVINAIPMQMNGTLNGIVVYFQNLEELQEQEVRARRKIHSHGLDARYTVDHFVSRSPAMQEMIMYINKFAGSDANILIIGESGVGKEVVAHSLHNRSQRKHQPFVALNCSTLQENLLDSELFGYEEGSFTGAKKGGKVGLFELAHKGTIFLDEIGELSVALQAKLLRVLQEKEIRRIGGERNVPVDVRIIAATNANLSGQIASNHFRKDLYFRLATLRLYVPPLRERLEDLPLLVEVLLNQFCIEYGKSKVEVSPALLEQMKLYPWPGNVRELENFLRQYVLLIEDLESDDRLGQKLLGYLDSGLCRQSIPLEKSSNDLSSSVGILERNRLISTLKETNYRRSHAARILGISRSTLWRKMHQYGLQFDSFMKH
jgi:transcriptional regulator with PAS, ATPase and Fis domain